MNQNLSIDPKTLGTEHNKENICRFSSENFYLSISIAAVSKCIVIEISVFFIGMFT